MPKGTTRRSQGKKQSRETSASQRTLEEAFSQSQLSVEARDEYVNKCVRYVLYRTGSNLPIRKSDLQKSVLHNIGRNFERVMKEVTEILMEVYGYKLQCFDEGNSKMYFVTSDLKDKVLYENVEPIPSDAHKVLIMLVLTHIYMSNNSVSETSLDLFLKSLNIDVEKNHELFGNVKVFINTTMVKQKYLSLEVEQNSRKKTYTWGGKAERTVSKHELLKWVCKMYKDRQPKSWTSHFEMANQQFGDNSDEQKDENNVQ